MVGGSYRSTEDLFTNNGIEFDGKPFAGYGTWVNGEGGAIYGEGDGLMMNIKNGTFLNNSAGYGGAIQVWGPCNLNETFPPVVLTVSDSDFSGNVALGIGGAFSARGSQIATNFSTSTFLSNRAHTGGAGDLFCSSYPSLFYSALVFDNNYVAPKQAVLHDYR